MRATHDFEHKATFDFQIWEYTDWSWLGVSSLFLYVGKPVSGQRKMWKIQAPRESKFLVHRKIRERERESPVALRRGVSQVKYSTLEGTLHMQHCSGRQCFDLEKQSYITPQPK